jgi:hypothetical protein
MPKACFVVRAVVEEPSREKFDHWYATDHFPEALAGLKPEKGWRFWSARETGVHYAVYRFADMASLNAALKSDAYKALAVDFDRKRFRQRSRSLCGLCQAAITLDRTSCIRH